MVCALRCHLPACRGDAPGRAAHARQRWYRRRAACFDCCSLCRNESSATLYLLFKYTEESEDWLIDAQATQSEDFTTAIAPFSQAPPGDRLSDVVPDVEVHSGFWRQFSSLAVTPVEEGAKSCLLGVPMSALLDAVCNLTGGTTPLRVVSSGFSLGAALSELGGVWAAQLWPGADVTVANQGGPIVGDENFVILAQATFGRAYKYVKCCTVVANTLLRWAGLLLAVGALRQWHLGTPSALPHAPASRYVYRLDEVPSIPPLPDYHQSRSSIWIVEDADGNTNVMLQVRLRRQVVGGGGGSAAGTLPTSLSPPRIFCFAKKKQCELPWFCAEPPQP